jgi:hypothetical protein
MWHFHVLRNQYSIFLCWGKWQHVQEYNHNISVALSLVEHNQGQL